MPHTPLGVRHYAVNNKPTLRYIPVPEPQRDTYTTEPTDYVQLLKSISHAKSPQRLQHLLGTYGSKFDAIHLTAAFVRLPQVLHYRRQDVEAREQVLVAGHEVPRTWPRPGAKLQESHAELASQLVKDLNAMLERHAFRFYPRQAASVVWALGELSRKGVKFPKDLPQYSDELPLNHPRVSRLNHVLDMVKRNNFSLLEVHGVAVDVAQLLQGLAKLHHSDPALVQYLADFVARKPQMFGARELLMAAYGMAGLRHMPRKAFDAIADRMLTLLRQQEEKHKPLPQGAVSLLLSFARAGVSRPDLFAALASCILAQRLLLTPQDMVTALVACGRLQYSNVQLLQILGDKLLATLERCSEREVVGALQGMAAVGYHHTALFDGVASSVVSERAISLEPSSAAVVLAAYARFGRDSEGDLAMVRQVAEALAERMPVTTLGVLAQACGALATWQYNDKAVLAAYASRAEQLLQEVGGNDAAAMCQIMRAFEQGGVSCYQLATAVLETLGKRSAEMSQPEVAELLYLCTRQEINNPDVSRVVLDSMLSATASGSGVLVMAEGTASQQDVKVAGQLLYVACSATEHERQVDKLIDHGLVKKARLVVDAQSDQLDTDLTLVLLDAAEMALQNRLAHKLVGMLQERAAALTGEEQQQLLVALQKHVVRDTDA